MTLAVAEFSPSPECLWKWMRGWEKLGNPPLFFPQTRYPRLLVNNVTIEPRITFFFFLMEVLVNFLEHLIGVVFWKDVICWRGQQVLGMQSTCQPIDQHLSAACLAPVSQLISTCQHLDHCLSAAWLAAVSQMISTCQQLDHRLSAAWLAPVSQLNSTCQHLDHRLSAVW